MATIFAPATAPGRAGVAVVRISGPEARVAAERLAGPLPTEGRRVAKLRDEAGGHLDTGLVLTFPAGRSFTGDETVELHLHGAPVVVQAVCACLGRQPGLKPAEPGAFTRRAFENGLLDLSQVEGMADLLAAETERQRQMALRGLSGELGRLVETWREDLIRAAALVEATIDFADEEVPVDVAPDVAVLLERLLDGFGRSVQGAAGAERLRAGFEVAIVGAPNTGKSTLLNRLAGREAAITSEVAGTTRDVIEVRMEIGGLPVTVLDTAGLRDTADPVERIGVTRARSRAKAADLRIHLVAPGHALPEGLGADDIVLMAKGDLAPGPRAISGLTGLGVEDLLNDIKEILELRVPDDGLLTRERHRVAIEVAQAEVSMATAQLAVVAVQPDLVAEHLRHAIRALDSLVGRIDVDHVLGEIFSSFCIGK